MATKSKKYIVDRETYCCFFPFCFQILLLLLMTYISVFLHIIQVILSHVSCKFQTWFFFPFRIHCKSIYCIYIQWENICWVKVMQNILKCDCLLFQYIHTVIFLPEFLKISATVLRSPMNILKVLGNKENQNSIHSNITFGQL